MNRISSLDTRWRGGLLQGMRPGGGWGDQLPIKGHGVPGLLAQGFRLMLGPQFFLKSGQALVICWREAILATKVQVIAQPLVIVRTLPSHNVLLDQTRLVATSQFRGDGEHDDGLSGGSKAGDECYAVDKG